MRTVASFILLVCGFVAAFWGGFCLLGGPDGRILSGDSFLYAGVFLTVAGLLITTSRKFVPTRIFIYTPMLVCMIAWVAALAVSQNVGFNVWVLGTPISIVVCMIYWLVAVLRTPKHFG
jgi:glucose dehydrogenase